jgi:hypothetical protein
MPMAWIEPEVFFAYKGVTVYHVYKDDHLESGTREYWFTLDITLGEGTSAEFDVRGLATWDAGYDRRNPRLDLAARMAIRAAIDQDLLELPWDVQKSVECKVDVNGLQLFFEAADNNPYGTGYVRVENAGKEVAYWDSAEWAASPQEVMGALMGCLHEGPTK